MTHLRRRLLLLSMLGTLSAAAGETSAAERPSVRVAKIGQPPKIDGLLDDAAWKKATTVTDFHLLGSHTAPTEPTEAWLASDGQFLYLAFRCHDAQIRDLSNKQTQRDGPVHQDDSVEVFLDPGTGGDTYFHFKLNVGNVQADQLVVRGQTHPEWNGGWQSGTFVDPVMATSKAWTAELAIPLYVLRQKAWGGPWRINLARNKRTAPAELVCWVPVEGGFHEPQHFGTLVGLTEIKPATDFTPLVVATGVSRYQIVDGKYSYEVFGEVTNDGGRPGTVEIVAEDRPAAGKPSRGFENLSLAQLENKKFRLLVPIAAPGARKATVILRDPTTGRVWHQVEVAGMESLNPLAAYTDRNYYTTEPNARVLARVAMEAAQRRQAGLRVTAALLGQNVQKLCSETPATADEVAMDLAIQDLQAGDYQIRVSLLDRAGMMLGETVLPLAKRAKAPPGATEVKIDQANRCLLADGKPFFPVGICASAMDPETLDMYRHCGFNTLIRWWGIGRNPPISSAIETLDAAYSRGLYVIDLPLAFLHSRPGHNGLLAPAALAQAVNEIPDFLLAVRSHPALLAYYSLDEAPGSGALTDPLAAFVRTVHQIDPYHPVYISEGGATTGLSGGTVLTLARYDLADVLGAHVYWCPMGAEGSDTPNAMARDAKNAFENFTEPYQRPLLVIPQSEITSWSRRPLTPRERRITVYLALIHGAKSIIYFASPISHRATVENMKELSAELAAIAPWLLTRMPSQEITVDPAPGNDGLPLVQAVLKDGPEGSSVLIAANSSPAPAQLRWDVSRLGSRLRVSDFSTRRKFDVTGATFTDSLKGYGTRVYRLEGRTPRPGEKAQLGLAIAGEAVDRFKAQAKPASAPPPVNLLANPSFEQQGKGWSIPGKPATYPKEGRNGTRCLKVVKPEPNSGVLAASDAITLKPNTAYRFGGWLRSELTEGRSSASFYLQAPDEGATKRFGAGLPCPPTFGQWKMFSRQITTPDRPLAASFWCQIPYGIAGEIRIDDVFVEEVPPPPREPRRKNLIQNSSFEEAALPGWPDGWRVGAVKPGRLIGDPGGPGQDSTCAVHGKCALRIANPMDQQNGFARASYVHAFALRGASRGGIPVEFGKTYVFSVYLRAEEKGTAARLHIQNFVWSSPVDKEGVSQRFLLGRDWQRYQVSCAIPREGWTRGLRPEVTLYIVSQAVNSAIWADAAQLEEGSQATPYACE